jgi:putative FmdB family regulatory protein|nr:MAG: FmdB family transcriptional regulator [Pseudomonadota bacterium]
MPFYEYQCSACGAEVEVLQKITDAPLKKCPECGRNQLQKLVSAPVFRLKGSGWYETDFKTDKDKKRNLIDDGSREGGESKEKPEGGSDAGSSKGEAESKSTSRARPVRRAAKPAARPQAQRRPAAKARPKAKAKARGRK